MNARLDYSPRYFSTCYHCGGTLRSDGAAGFVRWSHVTPPKVEHTAEPDDGAVSGPADDERGEPLFDYFGDERGSTAKIEG